MYRTTFQCLIITSLILYINTEKPANIENTTRNATFNNTAPNKDWEFRDYIEKFKPAVVWNKINSNNKVLGKTTNITAEFDNIVDHMDETDELLSLKIPEGTIKIVSDSNGRRSWVPSGKIQDDDDKYGKDPFYLRNRLDELMKHSIYATRNRMIEMQLAREKYRRSSLYKMGFLFSKTDTMCGLYAKVAFRAYKACSIRYRGRYDSHQLLDIVHTEERLLALLFNIELLVDLIVENDRMCKIMLEKVNKDRKKAWKFID